MLLTVSLLIMLLFPALADAGSWFQITSSDTVGSGVWSEQDDNSGLSSPHGNFSTTSNLCKTCHAVHGAGENSFRLLKDGSTDETRTQGERQGELGMGNKRSTECMYCHDATSGASEKRPYGLAAGGTTVRGEHTLGATWIPDSGINETSPTAGDGIGYLGQDGVLDCYQCHSVHGSNILTNIMAWGWGNATTPIDNYILRQDPGGNGGDSNLGIDSILAPWDSSDSTNKWVNNQSKDTSTYPSQDTTPYTELSIWKYEIMNAWCGDCHNENPNITGPGDFRPNRKSHPLFGGDTTDTTDAGGWLDVNDEYIKVSGGAPKGCDGCHMSGQLLGELTKMYWPHQGEGNKFLVRSEPETPMTFIAVEEGTKTGPGDSNRVVPEMDQACLWCHRFSSETEGVGETF